MYNKEEQRTCTRSQVGSDQVRDFTSTSFIRVRIKVRVNIAHYGQLIAFSNNLLRWVHLFDGVNEEVGMVTG